jgi:hypothetical protein
MNIINAIQSIINPEVKEEKQSAYHIFDHPFLKVDEKKNRHMVFSFQKPQKLWSREKGYYDGFVQCWLSTSGTPESDYEIALQEVVSSKENYLAWVKEWRDCYKFVTKEIRHAKMNRRKDHPDKSRDQYQWIRRWQEGNLVARRMMMMRSVAKTLSWENKIKNFLKDKEVIEI